MRYGQSRMKLANMTVPTVTMIVLTASSTPTLNAVSRPRDGCGVTFRPLGEAEPNWRCEATRSICTETSEGSSSRMPTTDPMPKFICPETWL
ncbi:hypothetical protein D3C87_1529910 [compost metagenome]